MFRSKVRSHCASIAVLACIVSSARAQLTVVAVDPAINASNRAPNASIVVDFDRAVSPATLSKVNVYGNNSGPIQGTIALENGGTRLRFSPAKPFFAGELVTTNMSHDLQAADSTFLRGAGFVWSFRVETVPASMTFSNSASWYTDPGNFTRIYGGQICDFDGDDYVDLAAISEVSADVRVFRNLADGTGMYEHVPFSITGVDLEPSPNENADMNGDGLIDIVTCNGSGNSVSVLLGNGPGTFAPAVHYAMGTDPHGLALFDCDGDGDIDVVTTNTSSSNVALRRNNGNGTLAPAVFFEGGGNGEYSLGAADMDNDGIFDLVVGLRFSEIIVIHKGVGNGTFTPFPSQQPGGGTWTIQLGDVNSDGKIDVSSANSFSNSGSILLGNGNCTLQAAQVVGTGGHTSATDLGDLDGDGDLDWILSVFGAQEWRLYRNDAGTFNYVGSFASSANPACASIADLDNDRDLDIVLWTETSDEIVTMKNSTLDTQTFCFGTSFSCACANSGVKGHGCEHSFGLGGGLLNASGKASVAADTLALVAGNLPPFASVLFFQGDVAVGSGAGSVFGDGLRCAGGMVLRLGSKTAVNGFATYGSGNPSDISISTKGAIPLIGGTRYYQGWFRNVASFCTTSTYNLTNGTRVTWSP